MSVQIAVAAVVVYRHKAARRAKQLASAQIGDPYALYGQARVLATAGRRAEAYALLARIESSADPQVKQMAASLRGMLDGRQLPGPQATKTVVGHAMQVPPASTSAPTTTHDSSTASPKAAVVVKAPRPAGRATRPRWKGDWRKHRKVAAVSRPPATVMPPAPTVPQQALLFVSSTPTAKIYLDGAFRGFTPQNGVPMAPGPRKLVLRAEGHRDYRQTVLAAAGAKSVVEVKLEPRETPRTPAPAVTKVPPRTTPPPMTGPIPYLRLPQKVVVPAYKGGKPSAYPRAVCSAVESVVSKAMKRSARGRTAALQRYILASASDGDKITLYPRVMGYLIAQGLAKNQSNIGELILHYHKSGRMASLADANWRP